MAEIESAPNPEVKQKRKYVRHQKTEDSSPVPIQDSTAILDLQNQILELVKTRGAIQENVANSNSEVLKIQATANYHRERLQQVEYEVRYRMSLISQLRGVPETTQVSQNPSFAIGSSINPPYNFTASGISSAPTMASAPAPQPSPSPWPETRTESAEEFRRGI